MWLEIDIAILSKVETDWLTCWLMVFLRKYSNIKRESQKIIFFDEIVVYGLIDIATRKACKPHFFVHHFLIVAGYDDDQVMIVINDTSGKKES